MSPRTGRPTDNPKPFRVGVRLDSETKEILDKYCEKKQVTPSEAVKRGIKKLGPEIKE